MKRNKIDPAPAQFTLAGMPATPVQTSMTEIAVEGTNFYAGHYDRLDADWFQSTRIIDDSQVEDGLFKETAP